MTTTAVLAHGLGGSADLPIPFTYAVVGAAWTLTFTFAVVALAWRKPRFDPDIPGRPLPVWVTTVVDAPVTRWLIGAAGLAFTAWVAVAAVTGPQDSRNALPGVFYVLLWVGLVALSLFLGPVWRVISPVRTVLRLVRVTRDGVAFPVASLAPTRAASAIGPPPQDCSPSSGSSWPAPIRDR